MMAKPLFERTFGQFARVLVDMDLTQTLRDKVLVERKGFAFFVELDYENLPDFCSNCKIIGHCIDNCKRLNSTVEDKQEKEIKDRRKQNKEPKKIYVPSKDSKAEQGKPIEVINLEGNNDNTNEIVTEEEPANNKVGIPSSSSAPEKEPTQVPRSNMEDLNGEKSVNSLANQNRFAALLDSDEVPVLMRHQQVDDKSNTEVTSSRDSEFVDATQMDDEEVTSQADFTVCNQKNKEFLKQSWANITENEEDELRLLEDLEEPHHGKDHSQTAPFTIVNKKARYKGAKLQSSTSKNNYGTRSKVGTPKPFK
jgi:hypothetical protein